MLFRSVLDQLPLLSLLDAQKPQTNQNFKLSSAALFVIILLLGHPAPFKSFGLQVDVEEVSKPKAS